MNSLLHFNQISGIFTFAEKENPSNLRQLNILTLDKLEQCNAAVELPDILSSCLSFDCPSHSFSQKKNASSGSISA